MIVLAAERRGGNDNDTTKLTNDLRLCEVSTTVLLFEIRKTAQRNSTVKLVGARGRRR